MEKIGRYFKSTNLIIFQWGSVVALFFCIYFTNYTNSLKICSLFFVLSLWSSKFVQKYFNKKQFLAIVTYTIFINSLLFLKFSLLSVCSFSGILLSILVMSRFNETDIYSIILGVFIDALIMLIWEMNTFSYYIAAKIFIRSLIYKISLAAISIFIYNFYKFTRKATNKKFQTV